MATLLSGVHPPETTDVTTALPRTLAADGVRYCHWKSGRRLPCAGAVHGDIDLLVRPADLQRFSTAVAAVGFKLAAASPTQYPGTVSFYALDEASGRFLHLHVHHQLWLGHWLSPVLIPVEDAVLATSQWSQGWRVPSVECELLLAVLRQACSPGWPSGTKSNASLRPGERMELRSLAERCDRGVVRELITTHLPFVDVELFDRSLDELLARRPDRPALRRLRRQLRSQAVWPLVSVLALHVGRRVAAKLAPSTAGPSRRLVAGGSVVAIIGGDGAGKSTAVRHLHDWLATTFETHTAHLGRPRRSVLTLAVGLVRRVALALRVASDVPDAPLTLLRTVCTARDRYKLYEKIRARAARGAIVLCDRYPLKALGPDGAALARSLTRRTRWSAALERREAVYYQCILPPDVLVLLDVEPETAARRKPTEDRDYVRARTRAMQRAAAWAEYPRLHVVDANRTATEVDRDLRRILWSAL